MSSAAKADPSKQKTPVAIIGMACIFPGAPSIGAFWENIVNGVDSIREAGPDQWDGGFYRNKSNELFGKIYCTRGGFVSDLADFDPLEFGIMPSSLHGSDPDQFLGLRAAAEALKDAGYDHKTFEADRADVIIGRTMAANIGSLNLVQHGHNVDQVLDIVKAVCPTASESDLQEIEKRLHAGLNPCNSDTIPGVMPNILAGRIAAKLGFRGRNLVLDAACASSLVAVEIAMQGLRNGETDLAIAGGIHINSCQSFYQMFCGLGALSQSGTIRPFDDQADGTILGEGVGMVVLKRLDDAMKDGNRIYAVIRGIGCSSDGRAGGSLAPNVEGEALAMHRAFDMACLSPQTVELIEAHGTGTRAGDLAEMKAIEQVFGTAGKRPWCAIGSIKSNIGHTQAASGVAGLIKAALALHHQTLPPTLNVNTPNSLINWNESPCYINSKARPWNEQEEKKHPRRAAVSAFGFGGVNAHVVLEEVDSNYKAQQKEPSVPQKSKASPIRLTLKYPTMTAAALNGFTLAHSAPMQTQKQERYTPSFGIPIAVTVGSGPGLPCNYDAPADSAEDGQTLIMQSFAQTMSTFHQNMLNMQGNIMMSYLDEEHEEA